SPFSCDSPQGCPGRQWQPDTEEPPGIGVPGEPASDARPRAEAEADAPGPRHTETRRAAWWIPLRSAFVPAKEEPGKAHPEAVFMCLTRQAPPLGLAVKPFLVLQGLGVKSVRLVHVVLHFDFFLAAD